MSFELSDRGFKYYEPTQTDHGHEVRIYESSAAMRPYIWIAAERTKEQCRGGLEPERAHIHATLEQAEEIHAKLGAAITNHYQLEFEGVEPPPLGMVPYLPAHNHSEEQPCPGAPWCPMASWTAHVAAHGNPYPKEARS